jgi:hypothetical protein
LTNRVDDILTDSFELEEEADEWKEGLSDDFDVKLLMLCQKGEIREFPWAGAGVEKEMFAKFDRQRIARRVEVALMSDGHEGFKINMGATPGDIKIKL